MADVGAYWAALGKSLGDVLQIRADSAGQLYLAYAPMDEGTARVFVGLDADKPAAGTKGRLYVATDTKIIYYDTGAAWVEIARGETVTRLAQLSERSHNSTTDVTADQHHNHATAGADGEHSFADQVLSGVDATDAQKGHVQLATSGEASATKAVTGTDSRLSDSRTPTVHGASLHTDITRSHWIPATSFGLASGSPALAAVHGGRAMAWLLDSAVQEYVATQWAVPEDWVSGTIVIKAYYSMASANTSDAVVMRTLGGSFADGDLLTTQDFSTSQTITVPDNADTLDIFTHSDAFTVAAGEMMQLQYGRIGNHANDNAVGDLQFLGVKLEYTASQ